MAAPAQAPKASGRSVETRRATSSTTAASARYSGMWGVVWPKTGPTSSVTTPRMAMYMPAAISAPPRPMRARARVSAMPAASISRIGWKSSRNCGTPKSNSAWKVDRPTSSPPARPAWRSFTNGRRLTRGPRRAVPSTKSTHAAIVASEAPPISMRWVGPQSVTSWPNSRCHRSSSGKPSSAYPPASAIRIAPTGAYQPSAIRTAEGVGFSPFGRPTAMQPAAKIPNSPKRIR
jgi:hypothetical protein